MLLRIGRTAGKMTLRAHPDTVRKDLDLLRPFHLGARREAVSREWGNGRLLQISGESRHRRANKNR